jgi:hypothetical protein
MCVYLGVDGATSNRPSRGDLWATRETLPSQARFVRIFQRTGDFCGIVNMSCTKLAWRTRHLRTRNEKMYEVVRGGFNSMF